MQIGRHRRRQYRGRHRWFPFGKIAASAAIVLGLLALNPGCGCGNKNNPNDKSCYSVAPAPGSVITAKTQVERLGLG